MKLGFDGEFTQDIRTPKRKRDQLNERGLRFAKAAKNLTKIFIVVMLVLVVCAGAYAIYMRATLPSRVVHGFGNSFPESDLILLGETENPKRVEIPDEMSVGGTSEGGYVGNSNFHMVELSDMPTIYPIKDCSIFTLPADAQGVYSVTEFADISLITINMPTYITGAVNVCTTVGHIVDVALWVKIE